SPGKELCVTPIVAAMYRVPPRVAFPGETSTPHAPPLSMRGGGEAHGHLVHLLGAAGVAVQDRVLHATWAEVGEEPIQAGVAAEDIDRGIVQDRGAPDQLVAC